MDFLILPDHPRAARLAGEHPVLRELKRLDHPSGRPWLLGPGLDSAHTVSAGQRRLAVFGRTRLDTDAARRILDRTTSPHGLDRLRVPGSVHLVASFGGEVRAQGAVSTARQLFTARHDGYALASSAPDLLASVTGAALDDAALAARLLSPYLPWPPARRSVWTGITALTPGTWLRLRPDGGSREVPWWRPPEPEQSLRQAGEAVRDALHEALAVRVHATGGALSCDLSGGLDSTALCFVAAAQHPTSLHTYHCTPADPGNEDSRWARLAVSELGERAQHTVLPDRRTVHFSTLAPGPDGEPDGGEGPLNWRSGSAHLRDLARRTAANGSRLHVMGLGGDELFGPMPAHLWSLARQHPLSALRRARRAQLLNRWPLSGTLRALADRTPYRRTLAHLASQLSAPPPQPWQIGFDWIGPVRMPGWGSADASQLVRELLLQEAAHAQPLDPDRLRHQILDGLCFEGTTIRQTDRALSDTGVGWEAPFLDDRVIEAVLSVRLAERSLPGRFKPLLAEAARSTAPPSLLRRTDKGSFDAELYEGLRRSRRDSARMCDGLLLGERGLANPDTLRSALLQPPEEARFSSHFEHTLATEAWLRAGHDQPRPARTAPQLKDPA